MLVVLSMLLLIDDNNDVNIINVNMLPEIVVDFIRKRGCVRV